MKAIIFCLAFIGLLSNVSPAQTEAAPAAATTLAAVPAKLQELNYLTDARPAADARFYVYLSSASWCGPCRAVMPKVVEQYPAIKAAGGEIILLCFDDTPRHGADYVKKYNAAFPVVMSTFRSAAKLGLPGYTAPRGIPNAIFVTPDGKTLSNGHGVTVLNWQAITSK